MDQLVENKTGVSRASMGLDPDAMQSTTRAAVQNTIQMQAGQIEVMVRNLADGMKRLFGIMLRTAIKYTDEEQSMRVNGQFVQVDPRVWKSDMDIGINVGLGTGREEEKMMALMGFGGFDSSKGKMIQDNNNKIQLLRIIYINITN